MSVAVRQQQRVADTGYRPRPLQGELHRKLKRFNAVVCHRRFGKTVCFVNEMIDQGLRFNKPSPFDGTPLTNPQYAYLAPTRVQAKRIAWEYLKRYTEKLPGFDPNEADLRVDVARPGHAGQFIRFMVLGGDNVGSLKGLYLDGVVPDEYGEMNPVIWREALRPALSDRLGWAIFGGTPKGRNHFHDVYQYAKHGGDPEWFAALYRADETGIIQASELESARRSMSPEEFNQEYLCSFEGGMVGAYFTKELADAERDNRITTVPYDPMLPVDTWWDLGVSDVMATWFTQQHRNEVRVIDYDEAPDLGIQEWAKRVGEKKYSVRNWNLPHDAKVRELGTGKSRFEIFGSLVGRRFVKVIPRVEDKLDSINAARMLLPRCVFDAKRCERGLKALGEYRRRWDEESKSFSPKPLHNWASNGADAFQQLAMGLKEEQDEGFSARMEQAETSWDVYAQR